MRAGVHPANWLSVNTVIGTPIPRNSQLAGITRTSCALKSSIKSPAPEPQAAAKPCRNACIPLVTSVGRINPAKASSGDMNDASPEIMTVGIANPTTPLIMPATSAITTEATSAPAPYKLIKCSTRQIYLAPRTAARQKCPATL